MGASLSEITYRGTNRARLISQPNNSIGHPSNDSRKRDRHNDASDEDIEELSPRRKKIQTTSNYIYETLFLNGTNSDMVIHALGECMWGCG